MNISTTKPGSLQKHRPFRWLEGLLLVVVLCVTVLRLSFIEQPQNTMQNAMLWTTPRGVSLLLSGVLYLAVVLGWCLQIVQGRWKPGVVMIAGWILFGLGAVISAYFTASDKRAAMAEAFTLVMPMFAAIVLVGWLDSPRRVSVVLWVILSMGCCAVYASVDQAMDSNQKMIEDYRQNPQRHLQMMGIEPNSLGQFQYEHRIYSKDIRGFLTTSNSTGTFLLAGIFIAGGLLADAVRHRNADTGFAARAVVFLMILLALLAGLVIGKSRGALAAAVILMFLFVVLVLFGQRLWPHRRVILTALLLMFAGVWIIAIGYGITHGRLPGPNAMYVRWQYWVGAGQMAAEHPLGVGGGNFGTFYTQYKIPAAPESVRDPHNVVLSLLCQFGPAALIGFTGMIFAALWRGLKKTFESSIPQGLTDRPDKIIASAAMVCTLVILLWIRPFAAEGGILGESAVIRQSVFIVMYLFPVIFFVCPFVLLWVTGRELPAETCRGGLTLGLICAVIAILVHNLIDFALFEPGVWTVFWLLIALILSAHAGPQEAKSLSTTAWIFLPVLFLTAAIVPLYIYVWIPVRAGVHFQNGLRDYTNAIQNFQRAADIDPVDPDPWTYMSRWSEYRCASLRMQETAADKISDSDTARMVKCLTDALAWQQEARRRDPANFKYDESIFELHVYLAEIQKDNADKYLQSAFEAGQEALRLYPGSDRIAYDLGILAEKMKQPQKVAEYFGRAVEIEDQYRRQFTQMYPGYPMCSRLGQSRYEYAQKFLLENPIEK